MSQEFSLEELSTYDGRGADGKIYISLEGTVFDVTTGRNFYGPESGSSYSVFAGKEAARALGVMSIKPEDCTGDISDLTEKQLQTLRQWKTKFESKYPVVGRLK